MFANLSNPCTRVAVLADVWVEDVMDMAVDILVIDARDDVVTKSLAGMVMLAVVVSDVVIVMVVVASAIALESVVFAT